MKRQLAEARADRSAEENRTGLTATDEALSDAIDQALDTLDQIRGIAATSPAGTLAKLFIAAQQEREDYRKFTMGELAAGVVPIVANAMRDMLAAPMPEDLRARVRRLAEAGEDDVFGEALRAEAAS
jgi:hypothetical protein